MQKKKYPKVVVLKKSLVGGVIVVAALMVGLMVHNVYQSAQPADALQSTHTQRVQKIAEPQDRAWADHQTVQTPVRNKSKNTFKTEQADAAEPDAEQQHAMRAPITSNQLTGDASTGTPSTEPSVVAASTDSNSPLSGDAEASTPAEKTEPLGAMVSPPRSRYVLQAGTVIPGILITGVQADLPKYVIGQVRCNVYDSLSGRDVLIPQGAKLIGLYEAQVAYGQERLCVAWQRLLFPNGHSMALNGLPGVDAGGYAGFKDQVDNHYGRLFQGALLTSLFGLGSSLSQPKQATPPFTASSVGGLYAQSLASTVLTTSNALVDKQMTVQPTLTIRPGYTFNILVTQDVVFPGAYKE